MIYNGIGMRGGRFKEVIEEGKSQMEIELWKRLVLKFGVLNLKKIAEYSGVSANMLWRNWHYGKMTVDTYEKVRLLLEI